MRRGEERKTHPTYGRVGRRVPKPLRSGTITCPKCQALLEPLPPAEAAIGRAVPGEDVARLARVGHRLGPSVLVLLSGGVGHGRGGSAGHLDAQGRLPGSDPLPGGFAGQVQRPCGRKVWSQGATTLWLGLEGAAPLWIRTRKGRGYRERWIEDGCLTSSETES